MVKYFLDRRKPSSICLLCILTGQDMIAIWKDSVLICLFCHTIIKNWLLILLIWFIMILGCQRTFTDFHDISKSYCYNRLWPYLLEFWEWQNATYPGSESRSYSPDIIKVVIFSGALYNKVELICSVSSEIAYPEYLSKYCRCPLKMLWNESIQIQERWLTAQNHFPVTCQLQQAQEVCQSWTSLASLLADYRLTLSRHLGWCDKLTPILDR